MKKKFYFLLAFSGFILAYEVFADDIKDRTDGSFVGDISNSMVNDSFSGQDTRQQTDNAFVGMDQLSDQDSLFAGSNFDKDVKESKVTAFAGDRSFAGDNYGK